VGKEFPLFFPQKNFLEKKEKILKENLRDDAPNDEEKNG
jgi:hypothetical protein